ncbi:MAG: guanine deaminase [Chromatocurvus sp.]
MTLSAHRGALLHFLQDPDTASPAPAWEHYADGLLVIDRDRVLSAGPAATLLPELPPDCPVQVHEDALILPGFIDTHIHLPQMEVVGAHGEQLLEWLEKYVFPAEAKFADPDYASDISERFLDELLRNGTTTALVFGSVHATSVDAFFSACERRNLRMIAGKAMMDRHCPDSVRDSADSSYRDSRMLIERWHGRGRLRYAVTPRFAPTSSPAQLALAGKLLQEHPGVYLHTHMSENLDEVAWVERLFPDAPHYLGTYDAAGLLGRRSVFAHCIHLSDDEWARLAETHSNVAFCPTSNLFLGSGLFPLSCARRHGVSVGLGTDIGGGTSFSLLQTLNEAYKVLQLRGEHLSPFKAFYLATLGGAEALDLADTVGNFTPGKEADFVIMDTACTPLLAFRQPHCRDLGELLFVLSTLGDDRAIRQTWSGGRCVHQRDTATSPDPTGSH